MNQRPLPLILAAFVLGEVWIWQFQRTAALAALILVSFILSGINWARKSSFCYEIEKKYTANMPHCRKKSTFYEIFSSLSVLAACGACLGGVTEYRWLQQKNAFDKWKDGSTYLIEGQIEEKKEGEKSTALTLKHLKIRDFSGNIRNYEIEEVNENKKNSKVGKEGIENMNSKRRKEIESMNSKGWKTQTGKLLLYADANKQYGIGHRIWFLGKIESFSLSSNPGEFNQRRYQEGKGVFGCCYEPDIVNEWYGSFLIGEGLRQVRESLAQIYKTNLTKNQIGPVLAMVLGDKSEMQNEQKELYKLGGISHILAVSGLHMTLLGAGLYRILKRAGLGYGISACFSFPGILAYAIMTGSSSSCLRASLMLMIYLLGEWMGRSYDLCSSLSLAGILLLIEIPDRLFDSGFLLSFGAMGGIGLFYPAVKQGLFSESIVKKSTKGKRIDKKDIINQIGTGLLGSLSVTVFTLPLSLYFFHGVSVAGIFLNLLVIPLMSLLFFLLVLGGCLSQFDITSVLGCGCLYAGGKTIDFYEVLCKGAEKVPGGYLTLGYRGFIFSVIYYLVLAVFTAILYQWTKKERASQQKSREKKNRGRNMAKKILSFSTVLCLIVFVLVTGRKDTFLTVLDVGQGDGILFHNRTGEVVFIDGGSTSKKQIGNYIIKPALTYYGISHIDNWIISHTDEDHISGLMELLETGYPIGRLILPKLNETNEKEQLLKQMAKKNQTQVYYFSINDRIVLKEGILISLHPSKKNQGSNVNENSLVMLLSLPFQDIFLTGDVEKNGEEILNKAMEQFSFLPQKERILKVAHHGSANSTGKEFLNLVKPHASIISCGLRNRYGHPAAETIKRLQEAGTEIIRTDIQGAVEIRCKPKTEYYCYGKRENKN